MYRWVEYFGEVLNRLFLVGGIDILEVDYLFLVNCVIFLRREISSVIRKMKDGKVVGIDNIFVEVFKVDINIIIEVFYELFKSIWEDEKLFIEWKEGFIVKFFKKGNFRECDNY